MPWAGMAGPGVECDFETPFRNTRPRCQPFTEVLGFRVATDEVSTETTNHMKLGERQLRFGPDAVAFPMRRNYDLL